MEVFHLLEFLGWSYDIEPASLNSRYGEAIRGSHVILFGLPSAGLGDKIPADAGLYEYDPDTGMSTFLRGASDFREFRHDREFIIIDGPPDPGGSPVALRDPLQRLCRILFPYPIVDEKGALSPQVAQVTNWVYERILDSAHP
jgi:hypothetical protein